MAAPKFIRLFDMPTVEVSAIDYGDGIRVAYRGLPGELVRSGVVTLEMTQPGRKGVPRRVATGQYFRRESVGRSGKLAIVRHFENKSEALALPGVAGNVVHEPWGRRERAAGGEVCRQLTALDENSRLALKAELMADVLVSAVRLHLAGHDQDAPHDNLTQEYIKADCAWWDDARDPAPLIAQALSGRGSLSLRRVADLARNRLAASCITMANRRPAADRQPLNAYGFAVAALGCLLDDDDGGGWSDGVIARLTGQPSAGATAEQGLQAFVAFHERGDHLTALWASENL